MTDIQILKELIDSEFDKYWALRSRWEEENKGSSSRKGKPSFRADPLFKVTQDLLLEDQDIDESYSYLKTKLDGKKVDRILFEIFRFSFLSQIVWERGGAANYTAHWFVPPYAGVSDPRYADCNECFQMFKEVVLSFLNQLEDEEDLENLIATVGKIGCVDYREKVIDGHIHRPGNIYWMRDDLPRRVIELKLLLSSEEFNPQTFLFFQKAFSKIHVKSYLTDRGQTGGYQTNREKRWETDPRSVHFALVRDCLEIEFTLIMQIFELANFPESVIQSLIESGVISDDEVNLNSRVCPITMENLDFYEFKNELENPVHGRATFQVGHIRPLKGDTLNALLGHTAQNICWISAEGNEIQKDRSVEETQQLILRIANKYRGAGIEEDDLLDEEE